MDNLHDVMMRACNETSILTIIPTLPETLSTLTLGILFLVLVDRYNKKTLAEQELEEKKQILKEINQTFNKKAR
jgi:hypothetical protein